MGTVATWWHCTARYLQGLLTCRPGFCIDCKFKVGKKKLTEWPSLVQEIVGEGIPKASQPRVRGCFKVTVRFKGWPSSWISGGTKETKKRGKIRV